MRIALAAALFMKPDLLLHRTSDEPLGLITHCAWLEEFLRQWRKPSLSVSHDRSWCRQCTTATAPFCTKKSYATAVEATTRSCNQSGDLSERRVDGKKLAGEFPRFVALQKIHPALWSRPREDGQMWQCRMKMLARLQEERVGSRYRRFSVRINCPAAVLYPLRWFPVMGVSFGYEGYDTLYENLDFGLDMDSRVAIVGPNVAGKSTFLKLVEGDILPTKGWINRNRRLR